MNHLLSRAAIFVTAIALSVGAYCLQPEPPLEPLRPLATAETVAVADDDTPLLPEPTGSNVITAAASLSRDSKGDFELRVAVRIAPGWHISATEQGNVSAGGLSPPTTLDIELPKGLEQIESWSVPEPELDTSGVGLVTRVYTGDVLFGCRLKRTSTALANSSPVRCRLGYQACNRFSCKPFETVTLIASIEGADQNEEE